MKPARILYGGLLKNTKTTTNLALKKTWADLKAKAVKELSGKRLFVVDTFSWRQPKIPVWLSASSLR